MAEFTVTKKTSARVPTAEGEFQLALYTSNVDDKEHLVLLIGDVTAGQDVLVRVHSDVSPAMSWAPYAATVGSNCISPCI